MKQPILHQKHHADTYPSPEITHSIPVILYLTNKTTYPTPVNDSDSFNPNIQVPEIYSTLETVYLTAAITYPTPEKAYSTLHPTLKAK